jgi:hypothetical protein
MVKFSREYEASIIPEWKAAFVDYRCLKKLVKRIKIARRDATREAGGGSSSDATSSYGFSVLDPVRALAAHFASATPPAVSPVRTPCPGRLACRMPSCTHTCLLTAGCLLARRRTATRRRRTTTRRAWNRIQGSSWWWPRPSM